MAGGASRAMATADVIGPHASTTPGKFSLPDRFVDFRTRVGRGVFRAVRCVVPSRVSLPDGKLAPPEPVSR
jgi:hypothetical protein